MLAAAEDYFTKISSGIPATHLAAWEAEITDAEANRLSQAEAMDVMAARTGGGAAADSLPASPQDSMKEQQWLELGLTLESQQFVAVTPPP